jgi:hypothetical protein
VQDCHDTRGASDIVPAADINQTILRLANGPFSGSCSIFRIVISVILESSVGAVSVDRKD